MRRQDIEMEMKRLWRENLNLENDVSQSGDETSFCGQIYCFNLLRPSTAEF